MEGEVIKSFLVGLGFGVDEKTLAKFNKSIVEATVRVTAMYVTIQGAAAGIFAGISSVSQSFEDMGYQLRLIAPAMNRWLVMRQAMLDAYSHAGVNLTQVVKQAILFNYSLAKTKFALEAVYKSVAAKFFPLLTKQMDIFRLKIFANMPKIQAQLTKFVQFIFKAFQATVELGSRLWSILTRVWDFFVRLDTATHGWSTAILGVVAAWKILNLSFLATPFGMLLAGFAALLVLYDDFMVWKEGGKSLFNWAPFVPVINAVSAALGSAADYLGDLFSILFNVVGLFKDFLTLDFSHFQIDLENTFQAVGKAITDLITHWKNLLNVGSSVLSWGESAYGWAKGHIGGGSAPAMPGSTQSSPLLPAGASSSQSVSQQTHITVNGAADANTVGKNVASSQDRVNFDMTRNLKGAMQ